MSRFFIILYNFFSRHKLLLYASLFTSVAFMLFFALSVKFEENISRFLPDNIDSRNTIEVLNNLKVRDKIVIMLSSTDTISEDIDDRLIQIAELLKQNLLSSKDSNLIKEIFSSVDNNIIEKTRNFVYNNLALFISSDEYSNFDSIQTSENIDLAMQRNFQNLLSPTSIALKDFIIQDPLGIGNNTLKHLQDFQLNSNYNIKQDHIFAKNENCLLMFISPTHDTGSTGKNDKLIELLESEISKLHKEENIRIDYFGGPAIGVYNARQIKEDTMLTSIIALIIIIVFILLTFKRKISVFLIITPLFFGIIFALSLIFFLKGEISAIAVGAGSAVMGIALSYSIHMLAHQNHVSSVQQLIREIAYPLTVGSFTTIGAFMGLLFTSSEVLRDFGLFASLTLIGTTLFCLIFLPHFLKGQAHVKQGPVLKFIEKINAYNFEKNKYLIAGILGLSLICLFTSQRVDFDSNMMNINYEPKHLKQAEEKLINLFDNKEKTILFVSVGKDMNQASKNYSRTNTKLSKLKQEGYIKNFASAEQFMISPEEQTKRLKKWNSYWNSDRIDTLKKNIQASARKYGFRKDAFSPFFQWLDNDFETIDYQSISKDKDYSNKLLDDWQTTTDSIVMLITQVSLDESNKESIYKMFEEDTDLVIFDRGYFTNKWVSSINDDFYLILYISSLLIFFALFIAYGRIELTLISFFPMLISWIIILGLMGILGIKFNIINIILSTFIFGIGDDFSIFIMDGLQNKYRSGKKVLNSHKTAIFFAAFTTIVGMGVLVFAKHPALQSISLISILGMISVVLVAYTIQPWIYKVLITVPTSKGFPPYTLAGVLRSLLLYIPFLTSCILLAIIILLFSIIPINNKRKKRFIRKLVGITCLGLTKLAIFIKIERINTSNEDFNTPAIIIANHQSLIEVIILLTITHKTVMLVNKRIWTLPIVRGAIRYLDFICVEDGYEEQIKKAKDLVADGNSILIFPEGTRSLNGKIKRFRKGAFYLAETLKLDIIPIILYGNNRIVTKSQIFNANKGISMNKILPRIKYDDASFGTGYREHSKNICKYMRKEYSKMTEEYDTCQNKYFKDILIKNYIYKGPVEEWYVRIKLKMEKNYALMNKLLPKRGQITDIGCGYGSLCYMLSLMSDQRNILGIDYDKDKIEVAQHGFISKERISFVHADATEYDLPQSDAFVLSDILHYLSEKEQIKLLKKCSEQLTDKGIIIARDGNSSNSKKHKITRFTEYLSTQVFKFNKISGALTFISDTKMHKIAESCNMKIETLANDKYTSNTIYIFSKR